MRRISNFTRRLRRQPRARFRRVFAVPDREHIPATLDPRVVYALGSPAKWLVFECPCGRGHQIQLNLVHAGGAQWTLTTDGDGQPTLRPSIDVRDERRCHFWLNSGRARWV